MSPGGAKSNLVYVEGKVLYDKKNESDRNSKTAVC